MKWQEVFTILMTLVVLGGTFWSLPVMKGADAFFGVPVSDEFYRSTRAKTLLRVYRTIIALFCLTVVALLAHPNGKPLMSLTLSIGCLVLLIVAGVFYRLVLPEETAPPTSVVTAALTPRRPWQYVSPPLEMVSLLLIVVTVLALWCAPPSLPPSDRKDVVIMAAMQVYMFVLMLTFLPAIAQSRVWLPEQDTQNYLLLREQYTRTLVGILYFVKTGVMLMFGLIVWAMVLRMNGAMVAVVSVAFHLAMLLGVALYCVRLLRQRKQLRALAGPGGMERSTDSRHWIGGLIYFNRDDPSLLVEKRIGIGWTFNFARPMVWLWTALMLAAPLLIAVLTADY